MPRAPLDPLYGDRVGVVQLRRVNHCHDGMGIEVDHRRWRIEFGLDDQELAPKGPEGFRIVKPKHCGRRQRRITIPGPVEMAEEPFLDGLKRHIG